MQLLPQILTIFGYRTCRYGIYIYSTREGINYRYGMTSLQLAVKAISAIFGGGGKYR